MTLLAMPQTNPTGKQLMEQYSKLVVLRIASDFHGVVGGSWGPTRFLMTKEQAQQ